MIIFKLLFHFLVMLKVSNSTLHRDKRERISIIYLTNRTADINETHIDRDSFIHILRHTRFALLSLLSS